MKNKKTVFVVILVACLFFVTRRGLAVESGSFELGFEQIKKVNPVEALKKVTGPLDSVWSGLITKFAPDYIKDFISPKIVDTEKDKSQYDLILGQSQWSSISLSLSSKSYLDLRNTLNNISIWQMFEMIKQVFFIVFDVLVFIIDGILGLIRIRIGLGT